MPPCGPGEEPIMGFVPDANQPSGVRWDETGGCMAYVPMAPGTDTTPTYIEALTDEVLSVGAGGAYGTGAGQVTGLQARDQANQLAREYVNNAIARAQALAAQGDTSELERLHQAMADNDFGDLSGTDPNAILPDFRPIDAAQTPEYHPQEHYDYLAEHPEQTVNLTPAQTGGLVPDGYVLSPTGQIIPASMAAPRSRLVADQSSILPFDGDTIVGGGGGGGGGITPGGGGGGGGNGNGSGGGGGGGIRPDITAGPTPVLGGGLGMALALGIGAYLLTRRPRGRR